MSIKKQIDNTIDLVTTELNDELDSLIYSKFDQSTENKIFQYFTSLLLRIIPESEEYIDYEINNLGLNYYNAAIPIIKKYMNIIIEKLNICMGCISLSTSVDRNILMNEDALPPLHISNIYSTLDKIVNEYIDIAEKTDRWMKIGIGLIFHKPCKGIDNWDLFKAGWKIATHELYLKELNDSIFNYLYSILKKLMSEVYTLTQKIKKECYEKLGIKNCTCINHKFLFVCKKCDFQEYIHGEDWDGRIYTCSSCKKIYHIPNGLSRILNDPLSLFFGPSCEVCNALLREWNINKCICPKCGNQMVSEAKNILVELRDNNKLDYYNDIFISEDGIIIVSNDFGKYYMNQKGYIYKCFYNCNWQYNFQENKIEYLDQIEKIYAFYVEKCIIVSSYEYIWDIACQLYWALVFTNVRFSCLDCIFDPYDQVLITYIAGRMKEKIEILKMAPEREIAYFIYIHLDSFQR